jgi:hypothetical protein
MNLQIFPRPVGEVGLGAFSAEEPTISLQDLAQMDIRVTWDEAVGIIEELCAAAQGLVMRPIPQASDILLNANGTVSFRQAAAGVPDPVEAARRLHELLGSSVAPAPLRLFISQAVSNGTYSSLSEFEDALAYFAKPGRTERVKAVYRRASEPGAATPSAAAEPVAAAKPQPTRAAAVPAAPYGVRIPAALQAHRQLVLVGLAAAGIATMVMGLGLYFWPQGSATTTAASSTTPDPAVAAEVTAGTAAETATATPAAASAPAPAPATGAMNQTPVARTASAVEVAAIPLTGSRAAIRYSGPRRAARATQAAGEPVSLPALSTLAAPPAAAASAAAVQPRQQTGTAAPTGRQAAAAASAPATGTQTAAPSQTLYSANDATVEPALLTKPQLLPPPYGDRLGRPVRLELIISPAGTVERARFIEAPQRMADMMILSSAKTWQFTPAMKDGQPVRYRTVMSWVAAP